MHLNVAVLPSCVFLQYLSAEITECAFVIIL